MMSATVTPSRREVTADCSTAPRADCHSRKPSTISQMPSTPLPLRARKKPKPISSAANALADQARQARGLRAVAGGLPDRRAGDPAAVERERGHEVEHEQERVHRHQEGDEQQRRVGRAVPAEPRRLVEVGPARDRHPGRGAGEDDRQRHERAGDGDEELLAGRVGVPAHLHHAAEEEEVDAGDLDPRAPRGERVPELVQHDRAEEQDRGHHGGRVARRAAAQDLGEVAREDEQEQEQDQEPGGVDADPDPEDPSQLE